MFYSIGKNVRYSSFSSRTFFFKLKFDENEYPYMEKKKSKLVRNYMLF